MVLILVDNLNNIILLFVFYVDNLITIIFYSKYFSYKISEQRKVLSYSKENSMVQIWIPCYTWEKELRNIPFIATCV